MILEIEVEIYCKVLILLFPFYLTVSPFANPRQRVGSKPVRAEPQAVVLSAMSHFVSVDP